MLIICDLHASKPVNFHAFVESWLVINWPDDGLMELCLVVSNSLDIRNNSFWSVWRKLCINIHCLRLSSELKFCGGFRLWWMSLRNRFQQWILTFCSFIKWKLWVLIFCLRYCWYKTFKWDFKRVFRDITVSCSGDWRLLKKKINNCRISVNQTVRTASTDVVNLFYHCRCPLFEESCTLRRWFAAGTYMKWPCGPKIRQKNWNHKNV